MDLRRHTGAFTDQAEQDLLRANKIVSKASGFLLGQHDHLDGLFSKPLEHGAAPSTSLSNLSGLAGESRCFSAWLVNRVTLPSFRFTEQTPTSLRCTDFRQRKTMHGK
jgi:hypothetical protein